MGVEEIIGGICISILLLGLLYLMFEPSERDK
jgi:hypothetical protein